MFLVLLMSSLSLSFLQFTYLHPTWVISLHLCPCLALACGPDLSVINSPPPSHMPAELNDAVSHRYLQHQIIEGLSALGCPPGLIHYGWRCFGFTQPASRGCVTVNKIRITATTNHAPPPTHAHTQPNPTYPPSSCCHTAAHMPLQKKSLWDT